MICKIFGHKLKRETKDLGNTFKVDSFKCVRCDYKETELVQRFWSAFSNRWMWANIDNKEVDLSSMGNNPRWLVPLVYSPDDFENQWIDYETPEGKGHGRLSYLTKKSLYEHYIDGTREEQTMVYHG